MAELVRHKVRFAHRHGNLLAQECFCKHWVADRNPTDTNAIADIAISSAHAANWHIWGPYGALVQVGPKTKAARFVNPQLKALLCYRGRKPTNSSENNIGWPNGISIVHVETGGTTIGLKFNVQSHHSIMDGSAKASTCQEQTGIPWQLRNGLHGTTFPNHAMQERHQEL
eukprot:11969745-Karenia_brevis.AAC.1